MNFDEAVAAVSVLEGESVDVVLWGPAAGGLVAQLGGTLGRVAEPDEMPDELERAIGETAVTFQIGDSRRSNVTLWPSRFVRARRVQPGHEDGVEIVTRDAVIHFRRYLPPWS